MTSFLPRSGRSAFKAPASVASLEAISPIFDTMKQLNIAPKVNPLQVLSNQVQTTPRFLSLAIGDPTVFGNLKAPALAVEAVQQTLQTYQANGYTDTEGSPEARSAVAKQYSSDEFRLTKNDVFLANGASGALHLAIGALCPRGNNILLPRPGFTYCVAAQCMEIECRYYDCLVEPPMEKPLISGRRELAD